jgi:DNA-directed RNA polymerase specialized sigma24 family protein
VLADDDSERLWQRVQELSPRCQRLLRIIAFDDRPDYAGIADELGMPIGSIGPTRGRCLAKLKALLTEGEGDD